VDLSKPGEGEHMSAKAYGGEVNDVPVTVVEL
jgi:hypothetical protein